VCRPFKNLMHFDFVVARFYICNSCPANAYVQLFDLRSHMKVRHQIELVKVPPRSA